jgi:4-alpha-glucanotransferase
MLSDLLRDNGIEAHDFYAVVRFLAQTRSRLLTLSLEDLLGVIDQPNIPGTIDEHANWRQRLPLPLDQLAAGIDVSAIKFATQGRADVNVNA